MPELAAPAKYNLPSFRANIPTSPWLNFGPIPELPEDTSKLSEAQANATAREKEAAAQAKTIETITKVLSDLPDKIKSDYREGVLFSYKKKALDNELATAQRKLAILNNPELAETPTSKLLKLSQINKNLRAGSGKAGTPTLYDMNKPAGTPLPGGGADLGEVGLSVFGPGKWDKNNITDAKVPGFDPDHGKFTDESGRPYDLTDSELEGVGISKAQLRAAGIDPEDYNQVRKFQVELTDAEGKSLGRHKIVDLLGTPGRVDLTPKLYKNFGGEQAAGAIADGGGVIPGMHAKIVPIGAPETRETDRGIYKKYVDPSTGAIITDFGAKKVAILPGGKSAIDITSPEAKTGSENKRAQAKVIAQAIANGRQPPDLTRLFGVGPYVREELESTFGYNQTEALADWTAMNKFYGGLNGTRQTTLRQAVDFTYHSLDIIEGLAKQWKGSGFPPMNKLALLAAKNDPTDPKRQSLATRLVAQINDLTSEMGTVYKGGNASTDETLKLAAENLKANFSEQTMLDSINLLRQTLKLRLNSINTVKPVLPSDGKLTNTLGNEGAAGAQQTTDAASSAAAAPAATGPAAGSSVAAPFNPGAPLKPSAAQAAGKAQPGYYLVTLPGGGTAVYRYQ